MPATIDEFVSSLNEATRERIRTDDAYAQQVLEIFNESRTINRPSLRTPVNPDLREPAKSPGMGIEPQRDFGAPEAPNPSALESDIAKSPALDDEKLAAWAPVSVEIAGGGLKFNRGFDLAGNVSRMTADEKEEYEDAVEKGDLERVKAVFDRDAKHGWRYRSGHDIHEKYDPEFALWQFDRGLIEDSSFGERWNNFWGAMGETVVSFGKVAARGLLAQYGATPGNESAATLHGGWEGFKQEAAFWMPLPGDNASGTLWQHLHRLGTDVPREFAMEMLSSTSKEKAAVQRATFLSSYEWEHKLAKQAEGFQTQIEAVAQKYRVSPDVVQDGAAVGGFIDPVDVATAGAALALKPAIKAVRVARKAPVMMQQTATAARLVDRTAEGLAHYEGVRNALLDGFQKFDDPGKRLATKRIAMLDTRIEKLTGELNKQLDEVAVLVKQADQAAAQQIAEALAPSATARAVGWSVKKAGDAAGKVGSGLEAVGRGVDKVVESVASGSKEAQGILKAHASATIGATIAGATMGGLPGAAVGLGVGQVTSPRAWHRLANSLQEAGRQLSTAPTATIPYWRRVARNTEGLPKFGAMMMDRAAMWAPTKVVGEGVKAGVKGAAFSGGIAYLGTGDVDTAVASAGSSSGIIGVMGAGLAFSPARREDAGIRRLDGDRRLFESALTSDQKKMFNELPIAEQWKLSQRATIYGDLAVEFYEGGKEWGSWNRDKRIARINVKNAQAPTHFALAHEIGHFMHDHGAVRAVTDEVLGSPDTRQPGMYSEVGPDGLAIVEGGKVKTNAEFARLKESYISRLPEGTNLSDGDIALEIFAEQTADRLLSPELLDADVRGGPLALFANVDWFESSGFVGRLLGTFGFAVDERGAMVEGTGLFKTPDGSPAIPRNTKLERIIREHNQRAARGRSPQWDMQGTTYVTPDAWAKNPEALKAFQASGDVSVDPVTGKINGTEVDANGKLVIVDPSRIFNTAAQIKATNAAMTDVIRTVTGDLAKAGKLDADAVQERTVRDEDGNETVILVGRYLPDEVLGALRDSGKFNPHQLETLETLNADMKAKTGQAFTFSYQPAQAKGKRGYKTLPMGWRTEIPYTIQITKDNNVTFRTVSIEKMIENARREVSKGKARLWDNNLSAVTRDLQIYLDNLAAGKPGDESIGTDKKNFLNNLLGIRTKGNVEANPLFDLPGKAPEIVITTRRLDRTNRLVTSEGRKVAFTHETYRRAKENLRPGDDSGFTPEEAERIRKGGERAVEQSMGRSGIADSEASPEVGSAKPQLAGERLPHSVPADELKLIHFSGRPGLREVNPKFFGKGYATPLDQRGDPKSYFFVQGSEYGTDKDLVTGDKKALYGATISGARIYDMNADALGILNEINRQTRDEILKNAGYAGLSILTTDNRNVVALFEPVGVKALQSDTQQFRPGDTYSWMKPDGSVIPVTDTHGETALREFKGQKSGAFGPDMIPLEAMELAWSRGWLRVANQGDDLYVHTETGTPSEKQIAELKNIAIENGKTRLVLDAGNDHRILWTDNEQFRPGDAGVFVSPNIAELAYEQAVDELTSGRQGAMKAKARELAPGARVFNVVGDWADGAENTVGIMFDSPKTMDETRKLAAELGIFGDQKSVLHFVRDDNGPDSLSEIFFPGIPLTAARQIMADVGLEFRSLSPEKDGTRVFVFDQGRGLVDKIEALTAHASKPEVETIAVTGEFLGSWTSRAEGRAVYRRVLGQAAGSRSEGGDKQGAGGDSSIQFRAGDLEVADSHLRISTRVPTAVKASEDALASQLTVTKADVIPDKETERVFASILRKYPNTPSGLRKSGDVISAFETQVVDNLLYLHDNYHANLRDRAKLWYVGARKIAESWSSDRAISREAVAGVIASLSPQKDWFMNVDLGRRVIDHKNTLGETKLTEGQVVWFKGKFGEKKPDMLAKLEAKIGTPFNGLHRLEQAVILRAFDEISADRGYQIISPEGDFVGHAANQNGAPSKVAWGDFNTIAKAISIVENPTRANISAMLGEEHKVRNFYNNILLPHSTEFGDVTIDTHAIAAALMRPLSGSSVEVLHNFGGGAPSSSITGTSGTYGIYADAYRQAAKLRGILPREMQSITWEAVRGLFPAEFKTAKNQAAVDAIWQLHQRGELSIDDTRKQIFSLAGGIRAPSWAGSDR